MAWDGKEDSDMKEEETEGGKTEARPRRNGEGHPDGIPSSTESQHLCTWETPENATAPLTTCRSAGK